MSPMCFRKINQEQTTVNIPFYSDQLLLLAFAMLVSCLSPSVQWFSLWDIYRYQPISPTVLWFELQSMAVMSCLNWSRERIQTWFIYRAIEENTAHVQWIGTSPKGSHLIHWTSSVFSYIQMNTVCISFLFAFSCHDGQSRWLIRSNYGFEFLPGRMFVIEVVHIQCTKLFKGLENGVLPTVL